MIGLYHAPGPPSWQSSFSAWHELSHTIGGGVGGGEGGLGGGDGGGAVHCRDEYEYGLVTVVQ